MRLDKYLKISRLIKRRTMAKEASNNKRILVNGQIAKPSKEIKDDIIKFQCHQCDFINDKLPSLYRQFVE